MADAVGQVLPLAIALALSPIPIIAAVVLLGAPGARVNGPVYVAGCLLGLAIVGTIVLLVAGTNDPTEDGGQAAWVSWLELLLGLLLVAMALKSWRGRPRGKDEPATPKWMGAIDGFGPVKAFAAGVVLAGANPKNLILAVGAATLIAASGASGADQAWAYAVFTLIGTIGVAAPVAIYFALGERSEPVLERLRAWMGRNNAVIMAVLCLVIGAKLVGDAIAGF